MTGPTEAMRAAVKSWLRTDEGHEAKTAAFVSTGCQGGFDQGLEAGLALGMAYEQARLVAEARRRASTFYRSGAGLKYDVLDEFADEIESEEL